MTRNKLYVFLSSACTAGYIWLILTFHRNSSGIIEPGVCLFKRITTIPCPSCGITRSILCLLNGDFTGALYWNPFGAILAMALIIIPIWICYDLVGHKDTLFKTYNRAELILRRKWIALPLIGLVVLNWIWNIYKGL
jgi:hypothetical protein